MAAKLQTDPRAQFCKSVLQFGIKPLCRPGKSLIVVFVIGSLLSVTKFVYDLQTDEEFRINYLADEIDLSQQNQGLLHETVLQDIPSSINWVNKGYVTKVRTCVCVHLCV